MSDPGRGGRRPGRLRHAAQRPLRDPGARGQPAPRRRDRARRVVLGPDALRRADRVGRARTTSWCGSPSRRPRSTSAFSGWTERFRASARTSARRSTGSRAPTRSRRARCSGSRPTAAARGCAAGAPLRLRRRAPPAARSQAAGARAPVRSRLDRARSVRPRARDLRTEHRRQDRRAQDRGARLPHGAVRSPGAAARIASLPVFRQVRADIGDHQSIDADLSTFSAHVRAVCLVPRTRPAARAVPVRRDRHRHRARRGRGAGAGRARALLARGRRPRSRRPITRRSRRGRFTAEGGLRRDGVRRGDAAPDLPHPHGRRGLVRRHRHRRAARSPRGLWSRAPGSSSRAPAISAEEHMARLRELTADSEARLAGLAAAEEALEAKRAELDRNATADAERQREESRRALAVRARGVPRARGARGGRDSGRQGAGAGGAGADASPRRVCAHRPGASRRRRAARGRAVAARVGGRAGRQGPDRLSGARRRDRRGAREHGRGQDGRRRRSPFPATTSRPRTASPRARRRGPSGARHAQRRVGRPLHSGRRPTTARRSSSTFWAGPSTRRCRCSISSWTPRCARDERRCAWSTATGPGRLRIAVRAHLKGHPHVDAFRPGGAGEGGDGATVVTLR